MYHIPITATIKKMFPPNPTDDSGVPVLTETAALQNAAALSQGRRRPHAIERVHLDARV
jgi:hypothetical protein